MRLPSSSSSFARPPPQVEGYTALLEILSATLRPAGKLLSLAVPPREVYVSMDWGRLGLLVDMINFQVGDLGDSCFSVCA